MIDDAELLHRYVRDGSEEAFAELVRRNLDLVYAAALRHVGDAHHARDVAQSVFIDLARKAGALCHHPALISWLYTSTRYAALKTVRAEQRRHVREQEAQTMHILSSDTAPDWERLRPLLDDVMHELDERDREMVLLRFFRGLPFAEIAATLRLSEGAARMRVDRVLDKMSRLLARRGISSTSAALGLALGSQPVSAAPVGLAASITTAALTSVVGAGTAGALGTLLFMSKMKIAIAALILVGVGAFIFQRKTTVEVESALVAATTERNALQKKAQELERRLVDQQRRATVTAPVANAAAAPTPQPVTPSPTEQITPPGVTTKPPAGWGKNGTKPEAYAVGVDELQTWGGMPSAYVKSLEANGEGFGGMMQAISAEAYAGQRVRLSGWIKTEDANNGGGRLWLRVDGEQRGETLQFDNMNNRAIRGTSDWQECSVVLDVPPNAAALAYGFFVQGGGKMWVSGAKIEPVSNDVASTNMLPKPMVQAVPPAAGPRKILPKMPTNLGFYPDRTP
jgi:RNA polymerase sigma factor (sigma-70 family)